MPTNDRKPTGTQGPGGRQNTDNKGQNTDRKQTSGPGERAAKSGLSGSDNPQKSGGKRDERDDR